jgi:hypothetical protein
MSAGGFAAIPRFRAVNVVLPDNPDAPLRDRIEAAERSGDRERLRKLEDEFRQRIRDNDREAVEIYRRHQAAVLSANPMAVGACERPPSCPSPRLRFRYRSPRRSCRGGCGRFAARGWWRRSRSTRSRASCPGSSGKRGPNVTTTRWCNEGSLAKFHPRPWTAGCQCGIRAVQSRTVLDAFARQMATRTPPVLGDAMAKVACWGNVAGFRADDDWEFTLRAQYAENVGPLEITANYEPQVAALEKRYGVEVAVR